MRILFTLGDPYLPQRSGGAQSSTDQLATALIAQGHEVAVLSGLQSGGWTELGSRLQRRLFRTRFARHRHNGYLVFRTWDPGDASEVVRRYRPDVAVVQNDNTGKTISIARSLQRCGVPITFYFRNVELQDLGGDPATLPGAEFIANSRFTAEFYKRAFKIESTVIPPLITPEFYRTQSTQENVTFINPVEVKGLDIALEVAGRCPDIPFAFVESWSLSLEERKALEGRLTKLPNVRLRMRTNDMRSIYGKAKIVLAPSVWAEAWGRIASEAHVSGIPVIGSNRGGLPEAIGPGGIVVDADAQTDDWVMALRRLWDDPQEYSRLSQAALAYAERPEIQMQHQLSAFLDVLRRAGRASPSSSTGAPAAAAFSPTSGL